MQQEVKGRVLTQYPDWHYQPLRLSLDQMANPLNVLSKFFDGYHLPQARHLLKKWLDAAMILHEEHYHNHIPIYDEVEKLVEAAWLILQHSKKNNTGKTFFSPGTYKIKGDDSLSAVIELLVRAIQPERIFLLHSGSKLIDLLIVIPDSSQKPFSHYEVIVDVACLNYKEVNFSLHQSNELNRHIEEGHLFYLTACTNDNLVYDNGAAPFPVTPSLKLAEVKAAAKEKFDGGMSKANSFFEGAKTYFEADNFSLTLFMLHQATELTFRAIICAFVGRDVKEHHISILKRHTRRCAPELNLVFPADTEKEQQLLQLLDKAYLDARYSSSFTVCKEDLLILFDRVQHLHLTANGVFTQKMSVLENV